MNRRILDLEIKENESELKELFLNEKDTRLKERLQFLYLLKIKEIKKIKDVAKILARERRTIGSWIKKYEENGLEGLLERNTSEGRPCQLSKDNLEKLRDKLSKPEALKSYQDIKVWILNEFEIELPYKTVFDICHYKLGTSPKVARPRNPEQDLEKVEAFKKKDFNEIVDAAKAKAKKRVSIWFEDESRFGLITNLRRKITLKGVKPIGLKQYKHKSFWIYGAVEPISGESFFMEYSSADIICFEDFLKRFSKEYPDTLNLIFLDGSGGHTAKAIKIPKNIRLHFLPPKSPELNPEERIWQELKKRSKQRNI